MKLIVGAKEDKFHILGCGTLLIELPTIFSTVPSV